MKERYKEQIYRPGEDVSKLDSLSDVEKSERRREIEEIFADPDKYQAEQDQRIAEAAANGAEVEE